MWIKEIYQEKPAVGDTARAAGGGEIFPVHLAREPVHLSHGADKVPDRVEDREPVCPQEKAQAPNPEAHEIQIHRDPMGRKGNGRVKRVIHFGDRNMPGEKGGPILQKEKVAENRRGTAESGASQGRDAQNPQYRPGN